MASYFSLDTGATLQVDLQWLGKIWAGKAIPAETKGILTKYNNDSEAGNGPQEPLEIRKMCERENADYENAKARIIVDLGVVLLQEYTTETPKSYQGAKQCRYG